MRGIVFLVVLSLVGLAPRDAAAQNPKLPDGTEPTPLPLVIEPDPVNNLLVIDLLKSEAPSGRIAYHYAWYPTDRECISVFSGIFGGLGEANGIRVDVLAEKYLGNGFTANFELDGGLTRRIFLSSSVSVCWYPWKGHELKFGYEMLHGPFLTWSHRL